MSYIKHVSPRGGGAFAHPCPCGIEVVTPIQDKLLEMFDNWYGDKDYRHHKHVVRWADTLSQMIIDNVMQTAQFRAIMKDQEEEHAHEADPRSPRYGGSAGVDGGMSVAGPPD